MINTLLPRRKTLLTHMFKAINNLKMLVAFILRSSYIIQFTMVLRNIE